jgi:hypothetical protein
MMMYDVIFAILRLLLKLHSFPLWQALYFQRWHLSLEHHEQTGVLAASEHYGTRTTASQS